MKKLNEIKQAILKKLGLNALVIPVITDSFGTAMSGQKVTLDKALSISAVWACVRLLSETVSTLPIKIYYKNADGSRIDAKEHDLYKVLCVEPNRIQTPVKMLEFLVASISIKGNAFFEKKIIGGRLIALIPILPQNVTEIKLLSNGKFDYIVIENNKQRVIKEENIWHIRGFGLDGILGIDVFAQGKDIIGAAQASGEASSKFFESGMSISGVLSVDQVLKPAQRDMFHEKMDIYRSSKNSGKMMVLEAGMKYQGIAINPEQAQLLETRGYDVEEICRLFKVPPTLIGYMSKQSSWASSLEALNQQFLTYTLLPILKNIEQSISRSLIKPEDRDKIFAKFNYEGFLRANSEARANYYSTSLNNGWMSRNEVREKEDLPPMDGGDIYTVQAALIPIDQVGKNYDKTTSANESA